MEQQKKQKTVKKTTPTSDTEKVVKAEKKVEKVEKVEKVNKVDEAKKTEQNVNKIEVHTEQPSTTVVKKKQQVPTSPTKSSKKKKESVKKHVDKGDAPNSATAYVGCTLNVNFGKKHLKEYIKNRLGLKYGTINAQYAYVAIIEFLFLQLVRLSGKYNQKQPEKADLFEITLANVQRGMRESKDFGDNSATLVDKYDASIDYTSLFFQNAKSLSEFIEKKAFSNTSNVVIPKDTLNFVCHVVLHMMSMLTKTACVLSGFAKKNNIGIKNYISACDLYFAGETHNLLHQRLSEIDNLFTKKKEDSEKEEGCNAEEEDDADIE